MRAVLTRLLLLIATSALLCAPTFALAQDGAKDTNGADSQVESDALRRLESPEMLSNEQLEKMGTPQRLALVSNSLSGMRTVLQRVQSLLDQTRQEERDVLKLDCINEKLSAVKGFMKVAEKAHIALEDAANRTDVPDQIHQTKLVQLAELRVRALGEEAEACTGEAVAYTGPAALEFEPDPEIRTDNPTDVETGDISTHPMPDVSYGGGN